MATEGESSSVCHERARRAVFGFLAAAVLHETNNVLTVMAGVRQLLRSGQTLSERVGTMIDQQLARMEDLVGAIRRVGPEEGDGTKGPRGIGFVLDAVKRIIELVGKGRGLTVAQELGGADAVPSDAEALALATLLTLLPALPPRGRPAGTKVGLRGRGEGREAVLELRLEPADRAPTSEPEGELARTLVTRVGGRLECRLEGGAMQALISVPLAAGPR